MSIANGVSAKGVALSGATITTSAVATQSSGSTIVVGVAWDITVAIQSVTDNKANLYFQIGAGLGNGIRLFYCPNAGGGSGHTVTLNLSGSSAFTSVFMLEITGGATSGIIDKAPGGFIDSSSPFVTNSTGTLSQAAELVVAFFASDLVGSAAINNSSGYTMQIEHTNGATGYCGGLYSKIVSSTSSESCSFTQSGAGAAGVYIVSFKELVPDITASAAWVKA